MRRAVAILAVLFFCGCASMPPEEQWVVGLMAADLGTTYYAIDHGASELNPLIRGNSTGETMLRGVALNALLYWLQRRALRDDALEGKKQFWRVVIGIRAPVVGWNLSQIYNLRRESR